MKKISSSEDVKKDHINVINNQLTYKIILQKILYQQIWKFRMDKFIFLFL